MRKIRVITDSSCDLNTELIKTYGITVVPLNIYFGNEMFLDRSIENSEFYKKMSSSKELPRTSCPSIESFLESYKGDEDLIVLTISSKLSESHSKASLAKYMYELNVDNKRKKIAIIDTEVGSIGQGQLAVIASRLINLGHDFEEIVSILERAKKEIIFYGILDTLENAIKAKKVNSLTGKIVGALDYKVIVKIGFNSIDIIGRAKGYDNAITEIRKLILDKVVDTDKKTLFIGHANNLEKALEMRHVMTLCNSFESINIVEVGASMGTYTGEGAILVSVL